MSQVESFIPLWEWDLPKKKKSKKGKGEKSGKKKGKEGKSKEKAGLPAGDAPEAAPAPIPDAKIEEVEDSGLSRPSSAQEEL